MKPIICKKHGLNIQHMWFGIQEWENKSDIIFIHDIDEQSDLHGYNYLKRIQRTVVFDLTQDIEVLQKNINKNYRYEIRRAEKENIINIMLNASHIRSNLNIIDRLGAYYEEMFRGKGIKNSFNRNLINKYIESDCFMLSIAKNEEHELVFHAYIIDKNITRLLYSCSLFRNDGMDKNLIGRANKYLHWKDIQYFKENGYKIYDWGGITSFEKPNGIDKFKLEFGGKCHTHYNYIVGISLIGRIALRILNFMGKI